MTLKEFLLARIAADEAPAREALEMDARFSSADEGLTFEYLSARLIHHACGRPVWQRRGSGLARSAASPAQRRGRLHGQAQVRDPTLRLWFGL